MPFSRRKWLFQTLTLNRTFVQGNFYSRTNPVTRSNRKTRLSLSLSLVALAGLVFPLAVLVYLLAVLVSPLAVLVFSLVILVFPIVCPFAVLVCPLVVSVCPLVVLVALPVRLFITHPFSVQFCIKNNFAELQLLPMMKYCFNSLPH